MEKKIETKTKKYRFFWIPLKKLAINEMGATKQQNQTKSYILRPTK